MKVLKFYADWCTPCKQLSKVFESVADLGAEVVGIDIDEDYVVPTRYSIRGVPTCVVVDAEGKELRRKVGMMSETDLRSFITG